ncbi:hypothetical protein GCM10020295_81120 [Streptomyces cinereospinus]
MISPLTPAAVSATEAALPFAPALSAAPLALGRSGPVLHVQLNPAAQDDVLSTAVLDALINVLDDLHDQPDVRVLVLSSLGDDFSLGADRREYQDALDADPGGSTLLRLADKAHRLCQALESTHAVTIARLHGKVVGAGLALAAYCDLRAGADTCRFRMPEVGIGLAPAWGGAMGRLITEAGAARIRELMLTCETFDAPPPPTASASCTRSPRSTLWTRPSPLGPNPSPDAPHRPCS